jgi:hypothetical protein
MVELSGNALHAGLAHPVWRASGTREHPRHEKKSPTPGVFHERNRPNDVEGEDNLHIITYPWGRNSTNTLLRPIL